MANFTVANLLTAQEIINNKYAQAELRAKPIPAFTLLSGNEAFIPDAAAIRTREDRTIETHLFARTKRTSGSTRVYNHTGTLDDTQKVTLTWTIKSDKFSIGLKLLDKNLFDFNTVFANKLEQACLNVLEDKETEAIAYLRATRATQQPTFSTKIATFNTPQTSFEINASNTDTFFQRVRSIMKQNYFSGTLDVITDSLTFNSAEYKQNQGVGNSTNLAFQFKGSNIVESVELSDTNYPDGIVIAMPAGSVGAISWIPKQNRQGWGEYMSYVGGYGTFEYLGYTFAVHGYVLRADNSGANGDAQDVQMEFEVSFDTSYNTSPISYKTSRTDSVIVQIAQTV